VLNEEHKKIYAIESIVELEKQRYLFKLEYHISPELMYLTIASLCIKTRQDYLVSGNFSESKQHQAKHRLS